MPLTTILFNTASKFISCIKIVKKFLLQAYQLPSKIEYDYVMYFQAKAHLSVLYYAWQVFSPFSSECNKFVLLW